MCGSYNTRGCVQLKQVYIESMKFLILALSSNAFPESGYVMFEVG